MARRERHLSDVIETMDVCFTSDKLRRLVERLRSERMSVSLRAELVDALEPAACELDADDYE